MGAKNFTQLLVWQKAHAVRMAVFKATVTFPPDQRFRLIAQMQSAALSVPAYIAEGFGRRHPRDKARFYAIAEGSADELADHLIFSKEMGWWPENGAVFGMLEEVRRMLRKLTDMTGGFGRS